MTEETPSDNGLAEDISDEKFGCGPIKNWGEYWKKFMDEPLNTEQLKKCDCAVCTLKNCPYHKPEWIDEKESEEIKE